MNSAEKVLAAAEHKQSANEFIATIAPMTATSGQVNILRELGDITDHDTVLEVWCGGGDLTAQLARMAGHVIGTDYSAKLIATARERFPAIEFHASSADRIAFPDALFDVVVSNFTAHHYSSPSISFGEARRVLKRGGRFLVTMPIQSKRTGVNIVIDVAREFMALPDKLFSGGPLLNAETADQIISVMRSVGFRTFTGSEHTHYTVLESVETLVRYVLKKVERDETTDDLDRRISDEVTRRATAYRHPDGLYRFPDQILAVRGNV